MKQTPKNRKSGFSLLELVITLVVGIILMMGMLPLIRIAANRGVEMQLRMRDVVELQSLMERAGAVAAAQTNLPAFLSELGSPNPPCEITGHAVLGDFYLHSADYVYFDSSQDIHLAAGATNLLEIRVGFEQTGPSLSKIFSE